MANEAKEYGQHLAAMLAASHFSTQEKQAWAKLVPSMSPEQLAKFDGLLRADMRAQSAHELENTSIALREAMHKRDLALSALNLSTHAALDALEQDLRAAS